MFYVRNEYGELEEMDTMMIYKKPDGSQYELKQLSGPTKKESNCGNVILKGEYERREVEDSPKIIFALESYESDGNGFFKIKRRKWFNSEKGEEVLVYAPKNRS